jgi:Mn2+/Fe2+ NRAMP family transporter
MDIGVGTFFSNIAMFFIILTTALTLHPAGLTHLSTGQEVAQALEPLAGRSAALLYTIGLLGTGALAIPTLAGSAAYALSETFGWREGINERFRHAPEFYGVVILSVAIGITFDWVNLNPVQALYWTAIINGLLAPFLLVGILLVASDRTLMRGQTSSRLGRVTVGITTAVMFAAGVAMFVL